MTDTTTTTRVHLPPDPHGRCRRHDRTARTREANLSSALAEAVEALRAVLPHARNYVGFINLRNDGSRDDEAEASEANAAVARAEAVLATADGPAA